LLSGFVKLAQLATDALSAVYFQFAGLLELLLTLNMQTSPCVASHADCLKKQEFGKPTAQQAMGINLSRIFV
jgi:hypothetical protein